MKKVFGLKKMNVTSGSIAVTALLSCGILVYSQYAEVKHPIIDAQKKQTSTVQKPIDEKKKQPYIIQSNDLEIVTTQLNQINGQIIDTDPSLNAINALLTPEQYNELAINKDLTVSEAIELQSSMLIFDDDNYLKKQ